MNYYKFNFAEYRRMTKDLPDAEDLAFRRMIDLYYLGEAPLPLDHAALEKAVGLDWDCIEPVLRDYFHPTPEGYVNYRFQEDVDRRKKRTDDLRQQGRLGGRPKLAKSK